MNIAPERSAARAVAYFFLRWILHRRFLFARVNSLGLTFKVKTQDVVGRHLYKYRAHEPELSDWLVRHLEPRPGDVFLDVGANIGWYTLLFSRLAGEDNSVFAFEPDPLNSALLRTNVETNGASGVEVVEAAVAATAGRAKLYRYNSNNLGRHSMLETEGRKAVEVDTVGLDAFCDERGLSDRRVVVLKVDVEGYEYFALSSGPAVLARSALVLCEYSPDIMREHGSRPEDLLDLFAQAGLEPWRLTGGTLEPLNRDALLASAGVLDVIWKRAAPAG